MLNSLFITLEGIEGVGKSTAVETVASTMISIGKDVLVTREPGGTSIENKLEKYYYLAKTNASLQQLSFFFY